MNKKERLENEKTCRRLLDRDNRFGSHVGCFRWHDSNSDAHELKKLEVFLERKRLGHSVMTEAVFEGGGRCDVLDLSSGLVIEILASETEEEAREKVGLYPASLEVMFVEVDKDE